MSEKRLIAGRFVQGTNDRGYYWPWTMPDRIKDWTYNKMWLCPTTQSPAYVNGVLQGDLNIFTSWGIFNEDENGYKAGVNGINGSYGLNSYFIPTTLDRFPQTVVPVSSGFKTLFDVKHPTLVPLMVDALRFDLWPEETEGPGDEFADWSVDQENSMRRCCINRHRGFVCVSFADGSGRKVGVKELWTLRWHKTFNTMGPWTRTGNPRGPRWPEWIQNYPDY